MQHSKVYILSLVAIVITGCGQPNSNQASDTAILNGEVVDSKQAAPVEDSQFRGNDTPMVEDKYPEVVYFESRSETKESYCTGTFVYQDNPNYHLMVTAAHCVEGFKANNIHALGKKAIGIYKNKNFSFELDASETAAPQSYDMALIKFPANTSRYFGFFSAHTLVARDRVVMVGFGESDMDLVQTEDGKEFFIPSLKSVPKVKRVGNNKYKNFDSTKSFGIFWSLGNYDSKTPGNGNGNLVALAPGDSGSPLFYDGGIVGIGSGGGLYEISGVRTMRSTHVDIKSSYSKTFFREALKDNFLDRDFHRRYSFLF